MNVYWHNGNPGEYIDTHAHLSMLKDGEIPVAEQLTRLFEAGFGGIIDIGIEADDLSLRLEAFGRFDRVRFSAGIWPSKSSISQRNDLVPLLERHIAAASRDRVIALGECGLDRHHNKRESGADVAGERELLELQLDMAEQRRLPIIIHSREAFQETKEILAAYPAVQGVIHCFSYGPSEARDFLDLGYYLSFAGTLTYKKAQHLREALRVVPLDRLFLETDAPFLAPLPFRGKPAHPGMVAETYQLAADLLKIDLEALQKRIAQNVTDLFRTAPDAKYKEQK